MTSDHFVMRRWFLNFLPKKQQEIPQVKKAVPGKIPRRITLKEFFVSERLYWAIIVIWIEKGFISPETHAWIDFRQGYKEQIVLDLKALHVQGYLKDNKHLSTKQIIAISWNLFAVKIKESTIGHTRYNHQRTAHIPPASEL